MRIMPSTNTTNVIIFLIASKRFISSPYTHKSQNNINPKQNQDGKQDKYVCFENPSFTGTHKVILIFGFSHVFCHAHFYIFILNKPLHTKSGRFSEQVERSRSQ